MNQPEEEFLYLEEKLATAKSRLTRCQSSIKEYTSTASTLANYPNQARRQVMTSVCNGLAYFDAVVENTNSFLVLLGDGWFAERSSKQSAEIAERRLIFLKDEEKMLSGQVKQIEETIRIAKEEQDMNNKMMMMTNNNNINNNIHQNDDENDDDDTDSFDSCDDLNLRELEDLEEEMLRATNGGEWSSEVLSAKVRERKEAKRQRRLVEEGKAQKTVSDIFMEKTKKRNGEEEQQYQKENDDSMINKKQLPPAAPPQHPGEIGVIEQLEILNTHIEKRRQEGIDEGGGGYGAAAVTSSITPPQEANSVNHRKKQEHEKEGIDDIEIPISASPSSSSSYAKVMTTKKDGTGGIVERSCGQEVKKNENEQQKSQEEEKDKDAEKPKKMSLFKQRKAGMK